MKVKQKFKSLIDTKTGLFILISSLILFIALILDFFDYSFSFHDILVEFHGLIFDLIVLGIILSFFENRNEKTALIRRYLEELEDYRYWESEESLHRTRGVIRRLLNLGIKKLDLTGSFLATDKSLTSIPDMNNWIFNSANLREVSFIDTNMSNASFIETDLYCATFQKVKLNGSIFKGARLDWIEFSECDLSNCDFESALVTNSDWLNKLAKSNNIGAHEFPIKYKLENFYFLDSSERYYLIKKAE